MKLKFMASIYLVVYLFSISVNFSVSTAVKKSPSPGKDAKAPGGSDDPLAGLSDAELEKMMKTYGVDSKDLGVLSKNGEKAGGLGEIGDDDDPLKSILDKKNKIKAFKSKNEIYEKNKSILRSFNINEKDAFNFVLLSKRFDIFSRLPVSAMNIINFAVNKESFKKLKERFSSNDNTNELVSNTANSSSFIDHSNTIGRKGLLTLLESSDSSYKKVWCIANTKVFTVYNSESYLNIVTIYRISQLEIKDSIFSPCFFLYNKDNFATSKSLLCGVSFNEKDSWIKTIEYLKTQYSTKATK